ncbi:predicted protein [Postia placenta Mad-698-R]|nr:predicted protein [Postia placenta Mad-698-R]
MTSLDLTGGAVEVGILISVFLYGVATVQAYIYIRSSAQDPLWLRLLVIVVWLLETFITVFTCMYLYDLTITHFGDAGAFLEEPWTIAISFALGGIASALVQSFFAWRVYIISGRLETSVISWTGSLVRVGITMTICMLLLKTNSTVATFERDYPWSITFSLALAMFIDVLNTCSLCFWLWRKRDGHHRSVAIVDKILIWTIGASFWLVNLGVLSPHSIHRNRIGHKACST